MVDTDSGEDGALRLARVAAVASGAFSILGLVFALLCGADAVSLSVVAGVLIVLFGVALLVGKADERLFPRLLVPVSLLFYVAIVLVVNNAQVSDFESQIDSARAFMAGDWQAYHSTPLGPSLYENWPDQIGYSLVEVLLLSVCDSVTFLKCFQAACMSCILLLVFLLARELAGFRIAAFLSIALSVFPFFAFMVGSTTNQILSALLCLVAVYGFCVARTRLSRPAACAGAYLACGVVVAIARFVRPDAVLVAAALAIVALCLPARGRPRNSLIDRGARMAMVLGSYLLVGVLISTSLALSGIMSPAATGDRVTCNKLLMGTDIRTSGGWSKDYISNNEQRAVDEGVSYQRAAIETVAERLTSPSYAAALEIRKIQRLWWGDPFTFCLREVDQNIVSWLKSVDKSFVFLLILANILALWRGLKKGGGGSLSDLRLFLYLLVAATIAAYLFIEVQPRYPYFAYIAMFVLAADGLSCLWELARAIPSRVGSRVEEGA